MLCQHCHKHPATVRVTEIFEVESQDDSKGKAIQERHLCEVCLKALELPHSPALKKGPLNIWQMIHTATRGRRPSPACRGCGMNLDEFRRKGRLGCPKCYEVFQGPVGELLERVHGARRHVGRLPGVSDEELERLQSLTDLRQRLEVAIREEAYESAARLRDEIQLLESSDPTSSPADPA